MAYRADEEGGGYIPEKPTPSLTPPPGFTFDPASGLYLGPGGNLSWDPATNKIGNQHPSPTPTPTPTVDPGPTPHPGPTVLPSPFTAPFTAPSPVNLGGPAGIPFIPPTPQFNPPTYEKPPAFNYQPFTAPTSDEIRSDPGYEFPLSQGLGAISNNAAARGLWASGGTGKAFQDYAQNYANQFSSDIYNRKLGTYMTNFNNALNSYATNAQTQYNTPYQNAYQSAKDQFAPQILGYQTQAQAGQRQSELNYSNSYEKWLADFNQRYQTGRFLFDVNSA